MKPQSSDTAGRIAGLLEIMRQLRDPQTGCPWDIKQDFHSIAPCTLEEAYEVVDAIDRQDWNELKLELGDLLLQTVYHCQIACEMNLFSFNDVVNAICQKMIRRHPHVFGSEARPSVSQQIENWEQAKAHERQANSDPSAPAGMLDGVALSLPALTRAIKLQKRAAKVKFDWTSLPDVIGKVSEELNEMANEIEAGDRAKIFEEFGDLLFSLVNFARHADIDAEAALRLANNKFVKRFAMMEREMSKDGLSSSDVDTGTLERYWERSKNLLGKADSA